MDLLCVLSCPAHGLLPSKQSPVSKLHIQALATWSQLDMQKTGPVLTCYLCTALLICVRAQLYSCPKGGKIADKKLTGYCVSENYY